MKNIYFMVVLAVLIIGGTSFSSYGQNSNGCTGGKRNGIINTNCWADTGDDTARLNAALSLSPGKIIFNEINYSISGTLTLFPYRIIEGAGISTDPTHNSPKIFQTTANIPTFKIGAGVVGVSIRDLAIIAPATAKTDNLSNAGLLNSVGILAEAPGNPNISTLHTAFSNVRITGFDRGIYVNSTGTTEWQFDDVKLDHCFFEGNTTGVEINADNSGWTMINNTFQVPKDGFGIKVRHGGYINMNLIVAGGPIPGVPTINSAETFIQLENYTGITIQNSALEGFRNGIVVNGPRKSSPLVLLNNVVGSFVDIKEASVTSIGNSYFTVTGPSGPKVTGNSEVYSMGDRFCIYEGHTTPGGTSTCNGAGWQLLANNAGNVPTLFAANTVDGPDNFSKAVLQLLNPSTNKPLLEIGAPGYSYTLKRDGNGWLVFEGSQADPYKGFIFNAPVKLQAYNRTSLPTGTTAPGSTAYCLDCIPNTSPCQSGVGALGTIATVRNDSQWHCN
jgi:hypothetical protein